MTMITYNYEDIFEEIPDDPDNILMKIPEEIIAASGWKVGDTIKISINNGGLILSKKNG